MKIFKFESRVQKKASSEWFHGKVLQDLIVEAPEPARVRALKVSFQPKARTAWHTHPLGQTLFVISGVGLVGIRNEKPKIIKVGDSIWIPPNQEHWHGATKDSPMEHIAIHEELDGKTAEWLEHVLDDDYLSNITD